MSEHWSFKRPGLPAGEPVAGKTYRADGWAYVDLGNWVRLEEWDWTIKVLGAENCHVLAVTCGRNLVTGERFIRGQLLISPAGQAVAAAHLRPPV